MIKPDVILRTNRKYLSLTISKLGEVIVRAPKNLSMEYIFNFLQEKEKWINSKRNHIININKMNSNLFEYKSFLILGKTYSKVEIDKVKKIDLVDDKMVFPSNISEEKTVTLAIKWFKSLSEEIIKKRVEYFSNLMQLNFNSCSLINSKVKWGSCDDKGNIKFNFRISMLPHKVIDYIVIHELAHLVEFNHSKKFYDIVKSVMPDHKAQRERLKQNNFILRLLR